MSLVTFFTILIIILSISVIGMIVCIVFSLINCSSQREKEPHNECQHDYSKWEDVGKPYDFRLDPPFYGECGTTQKRKRVCSKCNHIDYKCFRIG